MVIGVLRLTLYLHENRSLKGKRSVVRAIKAKVGNKFNVSVAECADNDNWQKISLGVAQVGNERSHVDRCLREVATFINSLRLVSEGEEAYEFDNY